MNAVDEQDIILRKLDAPHLTVKNRKEELQTHDFILAHTENARDGDVLTAVVDCKSKVRHDILLVESLVGYVLYVGKLIPCRIVCCTKCVTGRRLRHGLQHGLLLHHRLMRTA